MESEERGRKKGNAEVFNRIPLVGLSKIDGWLLPQFSWKKSSQCHSCLNFEDLVSWITTTAAALIGKWHVSKQSMTQPLVSFWLLFLVHFFSIDLEIIAFFFKATSFLPDLAQLWKLEGKRRNSFRAEKPSCCCIPKNVQFLNLKRNI